MDNNNVHVLP